MLHEDEQRIAQLQMEAIHFSFEDKLGSVVQKGIEAAQCIFRNESVDELEFAKTSLHTQMEIVMKWDKNRNDSTRKQVYVLCEVIEIMIKDKIMFSSSLQQNHVNRPNIDDFSDEVKFVSKIGHNETIEYSDHNNNSAIAESSNARDFIQANGHFDYTQRLLPIEGVAQNHVADTMEINGNMDAISKIEDEESYFDDIGEANYAVKQKDAGDTLEQIVTLEQAQKDRNLMESGDNARLPTFDESMGEMIEEHDAEWIAEMIDEMNDDDCNFIEDSDHSYNPNDEFRKTKTKKRRKNEKRNGDSKSSGQYKCDECDKAYDQNYKLIYHKRSVHEESEEIRRPFPCETCGKRFPTRCQLKRHSQVHFPESEIHRPFACVTCGKRFSTTYDCKRHSRVHSREMPVVKPATNVLPDTPIAPNPQLLKYMRQPKSSTKAGTE